MDQGIKESRNQGEMDMTPKELKQRYPYMFEGPNIGISFARGWQPVFSQLCEDIDRMLGTDKRGFRWAQVKEKFGSACFYFSMNDYAPLRVDITGADGLVSFETDDEADVGPPSGEALLLQELRARISRRARDAEQETRTRCIACGEAARRRDCAGYLMVLCDAHAQYDAGHPLWSLIYAPEEP
jgi:hypothetical protein